MMWEAIYQNGQQLNNHPFSEIVSFYYQNNWKDVPGAALDVGCGSGVHSKFLADKGFTVEAFDISESAIEYARTEFAENSIKYSISDINAYQIYSKHLELVIDRLSSAHTSLHSMKNFYKKVYNHINGSGIIFFQCFSPKTSSIVNIKHNNYISDGNQYLDGLGEFVVLTLDEIKLLFNRFEILSIEETIRLDAQKNDCISIYTVILKKGNSHV